MSLEADRNLSRPQIRLLLEQLVRTYLRELDSRLVPVSQLGLLGWCQGTPYARAVRHFALRGFH